MRLLRHILFLVNLIVAVLLLLSTMADAVSPSRFVILSLLSYAFLPLLIVNVVFALLWIFFKRWQCLLSIVVIALRFSTVLLCFQIGGTSEAKVGDGDETLKVMTFNVHGFGGRDGTLKTREGAVTFIGILRQQQPDVICVQEYNSVKHINLADTIKALGYRYHYSARKPVGSEVLFSRYPIVGSSTLDSHNKYYADIKVHGRTVRVTGVHLASYRLNDKDLSTVERVVRGKADNEALNIVQKLRSTVIAHEGEWNESIKPMLSSYEGPMIMMGDFNDIPTSYLHSQVSKFLVDTFTEHGCGLGTTYHGDFPVYRIDYIFHSRDLKALSYQRIKTDISDHYPVVVVFSLN